MSSGSRSKCFGVLDFIEKTEEDGKVLGFIEKIKEDRKGRKGVGKV